MLVHRDAKKNNIQHIHLRQTVTIAGLGCKEFDNAVWHFLDVSYDMDNFFNEALLKFNLGMWEGESALTFHSRYFTLRRDAPTERGLEFGEGVDPDGILKHLLGHNMVHTVDNKVKYSKRIEENGEVR